MKRTVIGWTVIGVLTFLAVWAALASTSDDPADCAALLRQAEYTSDVGTLLDEAGCVEPTPAHDPTAQP